MTDLDDMLNLWADDPYTHVHARRTLDAPFVCLGGTMVDDQGVLELWTRACRSGAYTDVHTVKSSHDPSACPQRL